MEVPDSTAMPVLSVECIEWLQTCF